MSKKVSVFRLLPLCRIRGATAVGVRGSVPMCAPPPAGNSSYRACSSRFNPTHCALQKDAHCVL